MILLAKKLIRANSNSDVAEGLFYDVIWGGLDLVFLS